MMPLTLSLAAAYFIGGIPNSYLAVRLLKGQDLRKIGSGNVGATNASRCFERPMSALVFAVCFSLDAAKGFLPAYFFAPWLAEGPLAALHPSTRVLIVGFAAIIGHIYTPFLKFQGGKGVATTLGVFLAADPIAMLIAALIGCVVILATHYVSAGSIVMGAVLPAVVMMRHPEARVLCALSLLAGAFIIFRHRANIGRLMRGEESRVLERQPKSE